MPEDKAGAARRQDDPSTNAPNTTALLGLAYQALGRRIVEGVAAAAVAQRPAHSAVFAHIDLDGGTRLSRLAARANVTPQAIGELVDDLERAGYVTRQPDPDDRRAKRIVLTRRGVACVRAGQRTIADLEARLSRALGSTRYGELHATLAAILELDGVDN